MCLLSVLEISELLANLCGRECVHLRNLNPLSYLAFPSLFKKIACLLWFSLGLTQKHSLSTHSAKTEF